MKTAVLVILCFATALFTRAASGKDFSDNILDSLNSDAVRATSRITYDIFEICPPQDCIILSLGRAGTLMDSFLRSRAERSGYSGRYVFEIPFVKLIALPAGANGDGLLKAIVPPEEVRAGRKVVILRSLYLGYSVGHVLARIVNQLALSIPKEQIGAIFIVQDRNVAKYADDTAINAGLRGLRKTFISPIIFSNFVLRKFETNRYQTEIENFHRYEPVLAFERHTDPVPFIENPNYLVLDRAVRSYLESSPVPFGQSVARNWCELRLVGLSSALRRMGL